MKITSYTKNGKTYYKFRIRLGEKVTTRSGFKSKPQAIYKYAQMMKDYEDEIQGNILYQKAYEKWLRVYETTVEESTLSTTAGYFKNHILPYFGHLKIQDITINNCEDFALAYKDYSKGKSMYYYAKSVMEYAKKHYNIKDNPFEKASLPRFYEQEKEFKFLEPKEVSQLINYFENNIFWKTLFQVLCYVGLRRGETLALTWEDIDFKAKTLTVNKALGINKQNQVYLKGPKNNASYRTLDLDSKTLLSLKELKLSSKSDLVFPSPRGGYLRLSTPNEKLQETLEKLGIKKITLHDLRHTHASLLFASGRSVKYVQDRMGHSRAETTMNIYVHVTQKEQDQAIEDFEKYMEKNS